MSQVNANLYAKMVLQYFVAAAFLGLALLQCARFISDAIIGRHDTNIVAFGILVWILQLVGFAALRGGNSSRAEVKAGPAHFRSGRLWEVRQDTPAAPLPASESAESRAHKDDIGYEGPRESGGRTSGKWIMRAAHVIAIGAVLIGVIGIPFTGGYSMWAITIGLPLAFFCFVLAMVVSKLES